MSKACNTLASMCRRRAVFQKSILAFTQERGCAGGEGIYPILSFFLNSLWEVIARLSRLRALNFGTSVPRLGRRGETTAEETVVKTWLTPKSMTQPIPAAVQQCLLVELVLESPIGTEAEGEGFGQGTLAEDIWDEVYNEVQEKKARWKEESLALHSCIC
eukprot:2416328-Amphidinium_carterae.3